MTWIAASFALLVLALAAGFAWWERTRPSSREVALVAALAALAALGRVAFAPIPNVKPTTDIVLLTGYVLGAGPGFATGAVAALASNVVFGQGPWTPWEMAGWGLVGLMGAGLGAATGRRVGRFPLALYCALAGLVYGGLLDVSVWVGYTGQHTLGQYLLVSGSSLPFNIAHATGNFVFCLAFGPAFVRALERFRTRLHVVWSPA
jgi:energy-coupling factor transport system substrate-specific component